MQRLPHPELTEFGVRATYHGGQRWAVHVMPFLISGTTDTTLYAADPVGGSATGSPNSDGVVGELDYNLWENVRLSAQYTAYFKFNGGTSSYGAAASGRSASDDNTLYFNVWLMF